jgi:hypothetical protein
MPNRVRRDPHLLERGVLGSGTVDKDTQAVLDS